MTQSNLQQISRDYQNLSTSEAKTSNGTTKRPLLCRTKKQLFTENKRVNQWRKPKQIYIYIYKYIYIYIY